MTDPETGEIYPAISCMNDSDMADRCTVQGAPKVIWSVKAKPQFNSDCAYLLREGLSSGRVRLLINEYDAETEKLQENIKNFGSLNPAEKIKILLPYINTTLLVDELIKLEHEEKDGKVVRIYERSGARKDRYSSVSYNYYVAIQLENKINKKQNKERNIEKIFTIRAPKSFERTVRSGNGRSYNRKSESWRDH